MNPKEVLTLSLKATIHIYQSYFIGGEEIKLVTCDSDNKTVGHGPVFDQRRFGARLTRVAADKIEKSPACRSGIMRRKGGHRCSKSSGFVICFLSPLNLNVNHNF